MKWSTRTSGCSRARGSEGGGERGYRVEEGTGVIEAEGTGEEAEADEKQDGPGRGPAAGKGPNR